MKLSQKLIAEIGDDKKVISITGAGGKTTLLSLLAKAYAQRGFSVLVTTTTKVQSPKLYDFGLDKVILNETEALMHDPEKGKSVFYAEAHIMDPKKCISPRLEVLEALSFRYDVTIVEADGAKRLPLKVHTERDPVILSSNTFTIAVMGLSAAGEKGDNVCFGLDSPDIVDEAFFQRIVDMEEGALKGMGERGVLLLNQADLIDEKKRKDYSALRLPHGISLMLASEEKDEIYE
jgi:probable selenium-dependent hydroxylase accessory protein YqeC